MASSGAINNPTEFWDGYNYIAIDFVVTEQSLSVRDSLALLGQAVNRNLYSLRSMAFDTDKRHVRLFAVGSDAQILQRLVLDLAGDAPLAGTLSLRLCAVYTPHLPASCADSFWLESPSYFWQRVSCLPFDGDCYTCCSRRAVSLLPLVAKLEDCPPLMPLSDWPRGTTSHALPTTASTAHADSTREESPSPPSLCTDNYSPRSCSRQSSFLVSLSPREQLSTVDTSSITSDDELVASVLLSLGRASCIAASST